MARPRNTLLALVALVACGVLAGPAQAVTYNVDRTEDVGDSNPGDGICDSNGRTLEIHECTLRAAIEDANFLDTSARQTINLPAGVYDLSQGVLTVGANIDLIGAGARTTVVRQTGAARVIEINFSDTAISGVTLRDGIAVDAPGFFFGGNIFARDSIVTLTDSIVTGGSGSSGGGFANHRGTFTLRRSTVAGNQADTGGGDGGAIQNGNTNGDESAAALIIENSTISGNSARLAGGIISGGHTGHNVTIRNTTIASNASDLSVPRGGGGGLYIASGSATVENSIVALNTSVTPAEQNCTVVDQSAKLASAGFNLESATDCGFTSAGDRQNANPLLAPLQNAGGPTDTRPLLAGSPAINAGNTATCLPTDQRGVARPQGPACDIGAFEFVPAAPLPPAPPDTVIVSAPPAVTKDRTPTFTFTSTEPGTTFECSLNNVPFVPCSSPLSLPRLPAGTHTFAVRARSAGGSVDPTPASFTFVIPAQLRDLRPPVLGRTVNAEPVSGSVLVAVRGGSSGARARASQKGLKFVPLQEAKQIPVGSFFNTRKGRVRLQSATSRRGKRQAGVFTGGLFQTLQSRRRRAKGVFELRLKGSSFRSCRTAGHGRRRASTSRHSRRKIRRITGNARGRFRTRGRYSAATVRGTRWGVIDRCDGTLTRVFSGRVAVRDFGRRKNVLVRRGKRYLARARR